MESKFILKINFIFSLLILLSIIVVFQSKKCGHENAQQNTKVNRINHHKNTRLLQSSSWTPIRIYIDYTTLDLQVSKIDKVQIDNIKKLMNHVGSLLQNIIKVKQESTNLVIKECDPQVTISPLVQNGVASDLVIFPYIDTTFDESTEAAAAYCAQDAISNRPLAGYIAFNKFLNFNLKNAFYYNTMLALHEMNHILSFSSSLFDQFITETGQVIPKTQVLITRQINGISRSMIATTKVLQAAKKHFNCNTMEGLELENQGGPGTAGSHWEARLMAGDFMIGQSYGEIVISDISLAMMEDSGWYSVNYYSAGLFRYGKNAGCDFVNTKCVNSGATKFHNEFTTSIGGDFCFSGRTSKGVSSLERGLTINSVYNYFSDLSMGGVINADYCPIAIDHQSAETYFVDNCWMGTSSIPSSMGEKMGPSSNCFMSSLVPQNDNNLNSFRGKYNSICYETTCDYLNSKFSVLIGNASVVCPSAGGAIKFPGFDGFLLCPDFNLICTRKFSCGDTIDCISKGVTTSTPTNYNYALNTEYIAALANPGNTFSSCIDNNFLINGVCSATCPDSYYANVLTKTCNSCIPNCLKCSDSLKCIKCKSGYFLDVSGQSCLNTCPLGTATIDDKCSSCTVENCAICDPNNLGQCMDCMNNTFLKNNTCTTDCGDGWYVDSLTRSCKKCTFDFCKNCSAEKCFTCETSKFLLESIQCVTECPNGYIASNSNCVNCKNPTECKKCLETNTSMCSECYPGKFLLNGRCLDKCPVGYFPDGSICEKCISGCNNCPDEFTCIDCATNFYKKGDICVKDCGTGYIPVNGICQACSVKNCHKCDANDVTKCTTCQTKTYFYSNTCVNPCPDGTFPNSSQVCEECLKDCQKCINKTTCSKCYENKVLHNNLCLDVCPDQFTPLNGKCAKCINTSCKNCDSTLRVCTSCTADKFMFKGSCYSTCPDGSYPSSTERICNECVKPCRNCIDDKSCKSCIDKYFLHGTTCVDLCPQGTVRVLVKCMICNDTNCLKCDTKNQSICLTCKENLLLFYGTCVTECPTGSYKVDTTCRYCIKGCKTCNNSTSCLVCEEKFNLLNSKTCIDICPDKYIKSAITNECLKCKSTCKTCLNTDSSKCSSCNSPSLLHEGNCVTRCPESFYASNGECLSCGIEKCATCNKNDQGIVCTKCIQGNLLWENNCILPPCPEGYGLISQTCQKCQVKNCKTCRSLTTCSECISENFLFGDKTCDFTCPLNYFKNPTTKKCEKCGNLCEECSDNKTCLKCVKTNVLLDKICVSKCPDGYVNINQKCEKCGTENCKLCLQTDPMICQLCITSLFLNNNKCVKVCPEYTFNKNSVCTSCPKFCQKCLNETVCTRCESLRVLLTDGSCSSDICPEGTTQINNTCVKCDPNSNCKRCDPKLLSKCTECYDQSIPVNGICNKLV
jgi:hypothetical protein